MLSAFVIGGASGSLGEHIAIDLHNKYEKVRVYDYNPNGSDVQIDCTSPIFADVLLQDLYEYGPNLIINFVGEISYQKLSELTLDDFDKIWHINMMPLTNIGIALGKWKQQNMSCNMIQIGSNSSSYPFTGMYSYCVAKSAQKMAIKIMAKELAPLIRVNMINPGPFTPETSSMSTRQIPLTLGGAGIKEGVDMMEQRIPMKRLCKILDLIKAIDYLDSDEYMTGQVLELSGGQII